MGVRDSVQSQIERRHACSGLWFGQVVMILLEEQGMIACRVDHRLATPAVCTLRRIAPYSRLY